MSDSILNQLAEVLENRKSVPTDSSYVAKLYAAGDDAILQKIGEEAVETILAAKGSDNIHIIKEIADLWFHSLVLLAHKGLEPQDVMNEF